MSKADHFLFFSPDLTVGTIRLDPQEARHATKVLRAINGDTLSFTDGKGCCAAGTLLCRSDGTAEVTIATRTTMPRKYPQIHLFVGLPERDAFETIIINATAFGVASVTPLEADYCQKPWWKGNYVKYLHRFTQLSIVSVKQSQGFFLPEINAPATVKNAFSSFTGTGFFADISGEPLASRLDTGSIPESLALIVGPPGGFSPKEYDLFSGSRIQPVKLLENRLRTELAVTVFCAQIFGHSIQGNSGALP